MRALRKLGAVGTMVSLLILGWGVAGKRIASANTLVDESGALLSGDAILDDGSLYDQYTFTASSGQYVTIFLESDDFDPYLILLDPDGERISENDDISRANRNSRLIVNLTSTGLYTAVANSYESGNSGEYVIKVAVGDSREGLMRILAAAAVPGSTEICQSSIVDAARSIESDRDLEVSVSPMLLNRFYASVPASRGYGVDVALSGPAALSVMFSPQMLSTIANELVSNCDSVGAIVFSSDASDFERTFGVVLGTSANRSASESASGFSGRRTARRDRDGLSLVTEEFGCSDSVPSQALPAWGEKVCL